MNLLDIPQVSEEMSSVPEFKPLSKIDIRLKTTVRYDTYAKKSTLRKDRTWLYGAFCDDFESACDHNGTKHTHRIRRDNLNSREDCGDCAYFKGPVIKFEVQSGGI